ncbi:hypothetical protein [Nostoc sp.]
MSNSTFLISQVRLSLQTVISYQLSVKTQGLYDFTDNYSVLKAIAHPKEIFQ